MPRLTLSGVNHDFKGLKELRERRGVVYTEFEAVGVKFNERRAKRDAGAVETPLWEGDEEARFNAADADLATLDAAITAEVRADEIALRTAAARGDRQTQPPGDGQGGGARFTLPARARNAGRLVGFRSEEDAYAAGQWVRGVLFGNESSAAWCREHLPAENRAMGGSVLAKGGALVPNAMSSAVIDLVEQYGVALADCENVPMSTDTLDWPRVTGGVTMYAIGENAEITESTPAMDTIGLTARKYGVLVKYPSELDEDSIINIGQFLAKKTAEAWAQKLDACVFLGDGTSAYHGIKGIKNALAAGSEVTALAGNTAFSTLDLVDFESMIGKMCAWAEAGAKWYVSKAGWAASMMRLADAAGGNTAENVAGGSQRRFLGYPVRFVQGMNSTLTAQTSTEGLAILGDLAKGVAIGLRRELRMKIASERYLEYDQIGFLATVRFDVNVHDVGTASAPGGIIQLLTPGS